MDHQQQDEQVDRQAPPQQQQQAVPVQEQASGVHGRPQQRPQQQAPQQWSQQQQPPVPRYPASQQIHFTALADQQRIPYPPTSNVAGNPAMMQQQQQPGPRMQEMAVDYQAAAVASAGPIGYASAPQYAAAAGYPLPQQQPQPQPRGYPPAQPMAYHHQMAIQQQQQQQSQQQQPQRQPLHMVQQQPVRHHPMVGGVPAVPMLEATQPHMHLPAEPYIQPRPGRLPKDRPLVKLSVSLIDTYKHINKVYYEERDARRAARAAQKAKGQGQGANNNGWDDENFDYIVTSGEMFYGRYVIKERIGKGSFGQVVRAHDTETNNDVAIKIIKSKKPFLMQAKTEIELLLHLQDQDPEDQNNIVRLLSHFIYRSHQCLVFEMLSLNLYELLKNTQFGGVSLNLIRKFAKQILRALSFLARPDVDIIHCDLKPENILLRHPKRSGVKVIDFGSSCRSNKRMYSYIQSRFYRSPEVMLGLPYSVAIDIWSLGCILVEMHTGEPLFSGSDQFDQMQKVIQMLGMVPTHMLDQANDTHRLQFFERVPSMTGNEQWSVRQTPNTSSSSTSRPKSLKQKIVPSTDPVAALTEVVGADTTRKKKHPPSETGNSPRNYEMFVDLICKMLAFDPKQRIRPDDALKHPFIVSPDQSHPASPQVGTITKEAPDSQRSRGEAATRHPEEG